MPATLAGMASQKPGKPPVSPAKTPAARNKAAGAAVSVQAKSATFKKKAAQPVGRPSSYCPEFAEQARKFCLLGATDKRLAELFEVSEATIDNWKRDYPEFLGSLKAGKEIADANVASSLYQRALGYSHAEDDIRALNGAIVITKTIKHYPPDTAAATLWLKNRQPQTWRDKVENEITGPNGGAIQMANTVSFVTAPLRPEDDEE